MERSWQSRKGEQGFTLLGVLLAVLIVGIMASVAVPRFTASLAAANTAKIQSDLSTIDTAIALYTIDTGTEPASLEALKDYLENYDQVKPPTGDCTLNGTRQSVPGTVYEVTKDTSSNRMHATLGGHGLYEFGGKKTTTSTESTTQ